MKLRVSNFDPSLRKGDIEEMFEEFGRVVHIKMFKNPANPDQNALAFVEMPRESAALLAIDAMNGKDLDGFIWKVEISTDKISTSPVSKIVKPLPVVEEEEEDDIDPDTDLPVKLSLEEAEDVADDSW